jgi:hypothetical protein
MSRVRSWLIAVVARLVGVRGCPTCGGPLGVGGVCAFADPPADPMEAARLYDRRGGLGGRS